MEGYEARLTLNWEDGFKLSSGQSGYEDGRPSVIWQYPYEKLRMSSDDGKRLLWLDFGEDDGEKVLIHVLCYFPVFDCYGIDTTNRELCSTYTVPNKPFQGGKCVFE